VCTIGEGHIWSAHYLGSTSATASTAAIRLSSFAPFSARRSDARPSLSTSARATGANPTVAAGAAHCEAACTVCSSIFTLTPGAKLTGGSSCSTESMAFRGCVSAPASYHGRHVQGEPFTDRQLPMVEVSDRDQTWCYNHQGISGTSLQLKSSRGRHLVGLTTIDAPDLGAAIP